MNASTYLLFSAIAGAAAATLLALGCAPRPGLRAVDSNVELRSVETRMSLERTACFGTCPVYRVTLSNGAAYFVGARPAEAVDTVAVDASSVAALAARFHAISFFALDSAYIPGAPGCRITATDHPTAILTLEVQGRLKRIRHYHGCVSEDDARRPVPEQLSNPSGVLGRLKLLAEQVDSVAGTRTWLSRRRF